MSKSRPMLDVDDMTEALTEKKNRNGYNSKMYKAQSDEHKAEQLSKLVAKATTGLNNYQSRVTIDFTDIESVKQRTEAYLTACGNSGTFPTMQGLAVYGYGMSRQYLNSYLASNPSTSATKYINMVRDAIADITVNSALFNNADATMSIFVLKNNHSFTDHIEIQPTQVEDKPKLSAEEIAERYRDILED